MGRITRAFLSCATQSRAVLLGIGAVIVSSGPAGAEGQIAHGPSEAIFLIQVMLLMLVGRLPGEILLRLRQPAVMGQLMAGLLLGPSVLGADLAGAQHALFPANAEQKACSTASRSSASSCCCC